MSTQRIYGDHQRFKEIVKGKVKQNLKKFISHGHITGIQGDKKIKIPIPRINVPRFIYDPQSAGGVSQGDGDIGDSLGKGRNQPSNKAGNQPGDHAYDAELSIDELAKLLSDVLELPKIVPKQKGEQIEVESEKYSKVNKHGPDGLRIFKRTYKQALKRSISSGIYDPKNPIVIPQRSDQFYKYPKIIMKPDVKVVIFYMMDVSGSMGEEKREIVKTLCFWIDLWLQHNYNNKLETRYIVHDTAAKEIEKDYFYKISTTGGTIISSPLELCDKIIEEEYDPNEWNIYCFQFSDGDAWNMEDQMNAAKFINKLKKKVNLFNYCEISSPGVRDTFYHIVRRFFNKEENVRFVRFEDRDYIPNVIQEFFK